MSWRKPVWWLLYILIPLLMVLLVLDQELALSLLGHQIVQLGIVFLFFGLVTLWVRANSVGVQRPAKPDPLELSIVVYDPHKKKKQDQMADGVEQEKAA